MSTPTPDDDTTRQKKFSDLIIRDLLTKRECLEEFLNDALPQHARKCDFSKAKPLKPDYFVGQLRTRVQDIIVELPYRDGRSKKTILVCILIEHQSQDDRLIALRTLIYCVLYWERKLHEWENLKGPKARFALPPIVPIVLHTGSKPWGTAKSLHELLQDADDFKGFIPDWKPLFWELAQHSENELLDGKEAFLQVLTIFKSEGKDLAEAEQLFEKVFAKIDPMLEKRRVNVEDLVRLLMGYIFHKRPVSEREDWKKLITRLEKESRKEVRSMITIADGIFAEGKAEGQREGSMEGQREGSATARRILLKLASLQFGAPPKSHASALDRITDLARLERMSDALPTVTSWAELLKVK